MVARDESCFPILNEERAFFEPQNPQNHMVDTWMSMEVSN